MAEVGSKPQGTRAVLFKQSSFLYSHTKKNERAQIEEKKNRAVSVTSPWHQLFSNPTFPDPTSPSLSSFLERETRISEKKVMVNNDVKTKTFKQWGTERQ